MIRVLMTNQVGWWHNDPGRCNHYAPDRWCTNPGGEWLPVVVQPVPHITNTSPTSPILSPTTSAKQTQP